MKRVLISYSHDSDEHRDRVRRFADELRTQWGVDATLDQYEPAPPQGWIRWMEQRFEESDFIILVCTEIYRRRFDDKEAPEKGLGVALEALMVKRELYSAKGWNHRFLPAVFDARDIPFIPKPFKDHTWYLIPKETEELVLRIHGQAKIVAPPIADMMKPNPPSQADPAQLRERYLREVLKNCGHLSMAGIDPKATQASGQLQLLEIFTGLDTLKPMDREQEEKALSAMAKRAALEGKQEREPALRRLSRKPKLVLLGQPGAGKSTLVNCVGLCLAGHLLGDSNVNLERLQKLGWTLPALFPVPVVLRDYAARGLLDGKSLWAFLRDELERITTIDGHLGSFAPALQAELKRGGILLLDGLDEVPEAHRRRQKLRKAIEDFEADFPEVRILVTSRPYAYDDPEWQLHGFERADLLDFSLEQIEEYIGRWYEVTSRRDPSLDSVQAKEFAEQLQRELKANPHLAELAPRPLLLALMVSLHRWRGGGALPQEREKLYDQSVDLLIDLWQRPKGKELSALIELGLGPAALRAALSEVAYHAHRNQAEKTGAADIEGSALAAALYKAPGRKEGIDSDRVIRYCKERAGLLHERGSDSKGQRIYAFAHRTFQEYLAACHLLDLDTFPDDLAEHARNDPERWREAVLLAANRRNNAATVWALVDALCFRDLPVEGSEISEPDWWGAFLAGAVLVETGRHQNTADRHLAKLNRVLACLKRLLSESALTAPDRAKAGCALAELGDPRAEVTSLEAMPFCFVPAGPFLWRDKKDEASIDHDFWMSEFPVTQSHFEVFVRDEGYLRREFWDEASKAGYWTETGFKGDYDKQARQAPIRYSRPYHLPNHPVVGVSWYEAVAFTTWLTARWRAESRLPQNWTVRLPTGMEWEKSARGGLEIPQSPIIGTPSTQPSCPLKPNPNKRSEYPWGDEFDNEKANIRGTGIGASNAVGCFPLGMSPYGCEEMSGNVWEWTLEKSGGVRAIRGGSFYDVAAFARVSYRDGRHPDVGYDDLGFRVLVAAAPGDGG